MDSEEPFDFHFIEEGHILPLEPELAMVWPTNLLMCKDSTATPTSTGTQVPTEHAVDKILQTDGFDSDETLNEDDIGSGGSSAEDEVAVMRQELLDERVRVSVLDGERVRLQTLQTKQEKALLELSTRMRMWMVAFLATALLGSMLAAFAVSNSLLSVEGGNRHCALCPPPQCDECDGCPVQEFALQHELTIVAQSRKIKLLRQKVREKEAVASRLRSCLEASTSTAMVVWHPKDNLSMLSECI
mmetsp:Transcript_861/g.2497  ORF Transcript_861/g.2497 Transcript_861/m.2497 type:complete len:244 (+) Transcript_861:96-827(+)